MAGLSSHPYRTCNIVGIILAVSLSAPLSIISWNATQAATSELGMAASTSAYDIIRHLASDVIPAALIGVLFGTAVAWLWCRLTRRRRRRYYVHKR